MSFDNYDDALGQLRAFGLQPRNGVLEIGGIRRCRVDGDREARGWYSLHELRLDDGALVLVGSYGIWRGNEKNAQKIELGKLRKLNDEQRAAIKKRMAEDHRRIDAERKRTGEVAATRARSMWAKLSTSGQCQYLESKSVQAYGLRFSDTGCAYVPMLDTSGSVHGLQVLLPRGHKRIAQTGRNKDFWPAGLIKKERFFQMGAVRNLVLIAEGYATCASLHEATGLPVIVAFDAGNLLPVGEAIRKRYRKARILFCADDDFKSDGNPGMTAASAAALAVGGEIVTPVFTIDREVGKKGLTDFNDLHNGEGLHSVRAQIEARLDELKWRDDAKPRAVSMAQGGGEPVALKSVVTIDEALERYALVYGAKATLFDFQERMLVCKADVVDMLPEHGWREFSRLKRVVRLNEVGFDPAGTDLRIKCNLWGGWPTVPKQGRCDSLLELLEYLCSGEDDYPATFDWMLKWLAYPIQHPGAKMQTAIVVHGPQGTGKNLFFESVMAIYGEYGRILDQSALEDKFNDWASRKLFMIADEVVARNELFHFKNKLKGLVTGTWIRINPKNVAAHDERNHVNIVFNSNESQPLVLEKDDRRYAVIRTPAKLMPEFYQEVRDEINNGGIAALHHYLLNLDLGEFNEHTKPPMTSAKADLIEIGKDSVQQFIDEWTGGKLNLPVCPAGSSDLFDAYLGYCRDANETRPRNAKQFIGAVKYLTDWRYAEEDRLIGDKTVKRGVVTPPADLIRIWGDVDMRKGVVESKKVWLTRCCNAFKDALDIRKRD